MSCHGGGDIVGVHAGNRVGGGAGAGAGVVVDKQFLINNCIDCHMPARASGAITMLTQQQKDPVADLVRSHYITIYPEETKKRMAALSRH
jgi:hypothetical protein